MKRGIAVLVCLCALSGAAYYAISKWGVQHETLNLFDSARLRPVAVDVAIRSARIEHATEFSFRAQDENRTRGPTFLLQTQSTAYAVAIAEVNKSGILTSSIRLRSVAHPFKRLDAH